MKTVETQGSALVHIVLRYDEDMAVHTMEFDDCLYSMPASAFLDAMMQESIRCGYSETDTYGEIFMSLAFVVMLRNATKYALP